jgi:hypothetical protein
MNGPKKLEFLFLRNLLQPSLMMAGKARNLVQRFVIEQQVLYTNAGKQLSLAATDVKLTLVLKK